MQKESVLENGGAAGGGTPVKSRAARSGDGHGGVPQSDTYIIIIRVKIGSSSSDRGSVGYKYCLFLHHPHVLLSLQV